MPLPGSVQRQCEYTVWDTRITGLGVRVRPSGHRSFVVLDSRNGSSKTPDSWSCDTHDCRRSAVPVSRHSVRRHGHFQRQAPGSRTVSSATLSRTSGDPSVSITSSQPPGARTNSALTTQLLPTFGGMPLDRIGRKEVIAWFDRYSGVAPGGANRVLDMLRQILNHAMVHGHLETNPASGIRRNPQRKFNRFLSRDEAQSPACRVGPTGLSSARNERRRRTSSACSTTRDAVTVRYETLKWCEVGADTLDLADSKTGPRKVYLNSEARRDHRATAPDRQRSCLSIALRSDLANIGVHATLVHSPQTGRASRTCASMICVTTSPPMPS